MLNAVGWRGSHANKVPVEGRTLKSLSTVASKLGEEGFTVRRPSEGQTRLRIRIEDEEVRNATEYVSLSPCLRDPCFLRNWGWLLNDVPPTYKDKIILPSHFLRVYLLAADVTKSSLIVN